ATSRPPSLAGQTRRLPAPRRSPAFSCLSVCRVRPVGRQRAHRTPWADTHTTVVDDMDWLCIPHHQLKTHQNWALVEGTGIRPFVPPHDPRHPDPTTGNTPDPDGNGNGEQGERASPANDPPDS